MLCYIEAERKQLSAAGDIFLSKTVQVDTHAKKGDGLEPRTLVSALELGTSYIVPIPCLVKVSGKLMFKLAISDRYPRPWVWIA